MKERTLSLSLTHTLIIVTETSIQQLHSPYSGMFFRGGAGRVQGRYRLDGPKLSVALSPINPIGIAFGRSLLRLAIVLLF